MKSPGRPSLLLRRAFHFNSSNVEQSVAESHHTQPFTLAIQAFTISASLVSVAKGKKPQPHRSIHRQPEGPGSRRSRSPSSSSRSTNKKRKLPGSASPPAEVDLRVDGHRCPHRSPFFLAMLSFDPFRLGWRATSIVTASPWSCPFSSNKLLDDNTQETVAPSWTFGLYVAMELISASAAEPFLYGSSTDVSALAILIAAIFWTWLWDLPGLLLSTPLTVANESDSSATRPLRGSDVPVPQGSHALLKFNMREVINKRGIFTECEPPWPEWFGPGRKWKYAV